MSHIFQATVTVSEAAYAAGDVTGVLMEWKDAVRSAGDQIVIRKIVLSTQEDVKGVLDVVFLTEKAVLSADNAALTIDGGEGMAALKKIGGVHKIAAADYADLGTFSVASKTDLFIPLTPSRGRNLYVFLVAQAANDYAAGGTIVLNIEGVRSSGILAL